MLSAAAIKLARLETQLADMRAHAEYVQAHRDQLAAALAAHVGTISGLSVERDQLAQQLDDCRADLAHERDAAADRYMTFD